MTSSGIEPATIRFAAQYLNHCATAAPKCVRHCYKYLRYCNVYMYIYTALKTYETAVSNGQLRSRRQPTKDYVSLSVLGYRAKTSYPIELTSYEILHSVDTVIHSQSP
jgi:hypothetical protein